MTNKIQMANWASYDELTNSISVKSGNRPIKMHSSDGTGAPLLKDGKFGADVIRFDSGKGVKMHTHEGAHILFTIKGKGYVDYYDESYQLSPGVCYLIPSMVPHAIRAESELILIAVGNDHRSLSSKDRLDMCNI